MLVVVIGASVIWPVAAFASLFVMAFWDMRVPGDGPVLAVLVAFPLVAIGAVVAGWVLWAVGSTAAATGAAAAPLALLVVLVGLWWRMVRKGRS